MSSRRITIVFLIMSLAILAAFLYLWHDSRKASEPPAPLDDAPQTPVVEPPPQIEPVDDSSRHTDAHAEAEAPHESTSQETTEPSERLDADLPADPVERLNAMVDALYANNYKAEATPLIEKLEEVYDWKPTPGEHQLHTAMDLFEQLVELGDPRAAPIIVKYACTGKIGGLGMDDAVVSFGIASVPLLVPYLKGRNAYPALMLARIVETQPDKLREYAEFVIMPRLEKVMKAVIGYNIYRENEAAEAFKRLNAVVERSK